MDQISDRLKSERTHRGLTQHQMAELLGVPYRTLQDNERGKVQPGAATLSAYAVIGVDLNWLVTGVERVQITPTGQPVDELMVKKKSVMEFDPFLDDGTKMIDRRPDQDDLHVVMSLELLPSRVRGNGMLDKLVYVTQSDGAMAPAIPKGAKLIVDMESEVTGKTAICLLRVGRQLVGRYVQETKDGYIVIKTGQGDVEAIYPATERASIGLLGLIRYVIRSV